MKKRIVLPPLPEPSEIDDDLLMQNTIEMARYKARLLKKKATTKTTESGVENASTGDAEDANETTEIGDE